MNPAELEKLFFNLAPAIEPSPLFIVGSPRTGSTPLYQAVASVFSLPYISNFINTNFAEFPVVGFALQRGVQVELDWKNEFGKTNGEFQSSEGSAVVSRWFGGGHPSQLLSREFVKGQEKHFKDTLASVEYLYGKPMVIKNPWNCFRVEVIAKALINARFVWIRRDIAAAAKSDLEARYITKGNPHDWNSATPANFEQLMRMEPARQVVENQYEFYKALKQALSGIAKNRYLEVWYEDFLRDPSEVLGAISNFVGHELINKNNLKELIVEKCMTLSQSEVDSIENFVSTNERFECCRYEPAGNFQI